MITNSGSFPTLNSVINRRSLIIKTMGCLISSRAQHRQDAVVQEKPKSRVNETDQGVLRIKLKRDNILSKRNDLQRRLDKNMITIKQLVKEKRKDEAIYYLGKKKLLEQNLKSISDKLNYIETRINKIEEVQDDVEFTNIVSESNQVLQKLMQQVDVDAVREANELDKEVNLRNDEILHIIDQNKNDPDIMNEYEMLGGDHVVNGAEIDRRVDELLQDRDLHLEKAENQPQQRQILLN